MPLTLAKIAKFPVASVGISCKLLVCQVLESFVTSNNLIQTVTELLDAVSMKQPDIQTELARGLDDFRTRPQVILSQFLGKLIFCVTRSSPACLTMEVAVTFSMASQGLGGLVRFWRSCDDLRAIKVFAQLRAFLWKPLLPVVQQTQFCML